MSHRIKVILKKVPGKRKKAIQLSLSAGFKVVDSISGDVSYRYLKLLVGESILESNWDRARQRPTLEYSVKDKHLLHHFIDRRVAQLDKAYRNLMESELKDAVSPDDVRDEYMALIGEKRKTMVQSRVADFISQYHQTSRKEKEATKRHYRLLEKRIREFEGENKVSLYWQTFSAQEHEAFIHWLQDSYSLSANSLWNFEKLLVKFRNLARQHGLIKMDKSWVRQTRYKQEDKMYLTWSMLRAVMDFQPQTNSLKNAKSIFILLCFTGIRYSDLDRFLANYVDDHPFGWSRFNLTKYPSPKVVIPSLEPVRRLMLNSPPKYVSPSHFHGLVKVLMSKVFGAATGRLISAHTCRRTFVSLLLPHVPESVLAKITGHKITGSSAVFHGYNRIDLKDNSLLFMRHLRNVPLEETEGIRLVRFSEEVVMN